MGLNFEELVQHSAELPNEMAGEHFASRKVTWLMVSQNGQVVLKFSSRVQMQGEWKLYRATGQLWQLGHFVGGKKDGPWQRYTKDDKVTRPGS